MRNLINIFINTCTWWWPCKADKCSTIWHEIVIKLELQLTVFVDINSCKKPNNSINQSIFLPVYNGNVFFFFLTFTKLSKSVFVESNQTKFLPISNLLVYMNADTGIINNTYINLNCSQHQHYWNWLLPVKCYKQHHIYKHQWRSTWVL